MTYKERKENIDKELNPNFFEEFNRDDIDKGKTMAESYSGWFNDRIVQYLVHGRNIDNPKETDYPFYASDYDYYRTRMAKATLLTAQIDDWVNPIMSRDYEIKNQENKKEYIERLFDTNNLEVNDLRNFIKLGLHKDLKKLNFEDYSFDLLQNLQELQKIVWMGCTKNTDQIFLNYFDGKRSINEISVIYGVTHQNVSKKLTRICKNALKKLRAHKGCACLNEEVDNKLSA